MLSSLLKKIFLFSFFFAPYFSDAGIETGTTCAPFKVHLHAQVPLPPPTNIPEILPKNWEPNLVEKIGKIKTQNDFPRFYQNWLKSHAEELSENNRYLWLQCLLFYTSLDTNQNGLPDWSAIVDHQPARILYPQDPDQDGDGISNVLDSDPLIPEKNKIKQNKVKIPAHLKIDSQKRPAVSQLQKQLYKDFGILAVDHTDEHSPVVLRELLFLLQKSFSKKIISDLKINYIYAFSGHDPIRTTASYHPLASAISIGGMKSYPNNEIDIQTKINLLSALSHEIGHAILMQKINPVDLAQISSQFSNWKEINNSDLSDLFFSPVFFEPYPLKQRRNIVSQYAMKNRHEWFAESLTASVLNELGKSGALDNNWQSTLKRTSSDRSEYWVDYTNINHDFQDWLQHLIRK